MRARCPAHAGHRGADNGSVCVLSRKTSAQDQSAPRSGPPPLGQFPQQHQNDRGNFSGSRLGADLHVIASIAVRNRPTAGGIRTLGPPRGTAFFETAPFELSGSERDGLFWTRPALWVLSGGLGARPERGVHPLKARHLAEERERGVVPVTERLGGLCRIGPRPAAPRASRRVPPCRRSSVQLPWDPPSFRNPRETQRCYQ